MCQHYMSINDIPIMVDLNPLLYPHHDRYFDQSLSLMDHTNYTYMYLYIYVHIYYIYIYYI